MTICAAFIVMLAGLALTAQSQDSKAPKQAKEVHLEVQSSPKM